MLIFSRIFNLITQNSLAYLANNNNNKSHLNPGKLHALDRLETGQSAS